MIAKLTGQLDSLGTDHAVIDVGGVGYLVYGARRMLAGLGTPGSPVSLLIETHMREDHIHLYGFATAGERDWFRLLTTVQGVGAKVALALLSHLSAEDLILALSAQDKAMLTRAEGVGPKLAARIINELKDKVGALDLAGAKLPAAASASSDTASGTEDSLQGDAISALVNLGYQRGEAFTATTRARQTLPEDQITLSHLITESLRLLTIA